MPGLVAAFCLVFLSAVAELTATLLLIPTGADAAGTISIGGSPVHRRPGCGPGPAEQINLGPNEDGLTARVTSYRYHGHDAVLCVQPGNDAEARPIVVRITGGPHRPVGSAVTLRARGPVLAWAAD